MLQPLATVLAALVAAFVGSWFGTVQALSKLRRERAFDRQLDWYERFIRSVHDLSQKVEVALTFQGEPHTSPEFLTQLWRTVQSAHLSFDRLAMEAPLYASSAALRHAVKLQAQAQEVANQSEAFDPLSMSGEGREAALESIRMLPHRLHKGSEPLIASARDHLGIE